MLYEFYGTECPHCERMRNVVESVEKKHNVTFERKEVWHDEDNLAFLKECDKNDECGGVPFFYNDETGKWICGEATEEELESII
ncbi:hypothetical protein H6790_00845 [Candidatus Nomurabacteria bacterium]|nr:hypothetical protein [Candidatus Nomurabacteria bacterium]MCB9820480.1 hypothetical protein [Candidatus Nomurabacteria bacterium]